MKEFILNLKDKILKGESIAFDEALKLIKIDENDTCSLNVLFESANEIRENLVGKKADLCIILNAKSGRCSENCKFCAQSAHYNTGVLEYDLLEYSEVLEKALEAKENGVHRFSLVTSGKGVDKDEDIEKLAKIYERLSKDVGIELCASHGILTYRQAKTLKEAGVITYHHNVETSKNHYKNICTTHTYEDRVKTIENAKKAGRLGGRGADEDLLRARVEDMSEKQLAKEMQRLEKEMLGHAQNLEFEKAAALRDELFRVKEQLFGVAKHDSDD